jgi:probable F420-dependent oxidoreductase
VKVDLAFPLDGPADVRDAAARGEQAGYAALWTAETQHDPFVALTLAATVTERAQLGTAIALAFARNPMSLAVQANDLQTISGGRLLLGLGSQIKTHITRRFSMPWSHPAARMREYVLALRAIWACWNDGSRLSFRGDFYTHTVMTPFFSPGPGPFGPPPVLLAGVGPVMTAVAGEVADGFLCHGFTTERYLREVTLPALAEGRQHAAQSPATARRDDFEIAGSPMVATGRTEEELTAAAAGVRSQIAFYGSTPAYRPVLERHGWGPLADELHTLSRTGRWDDMAALIDDDVLAAFAVVTEPARVAPELLRRYGDIMTRMTLYTPYQAAAGLVAAIGAEIQAG